MDRKWTYLMFAAGGILLIYLLSKTGMWIWAYLDSTDFAGEIVGKPRPYLIDFVSFALAAGATAVALRHEQLFELATEVTSELRKVTWPNRQETFAATIVVIVTVIISAIFLGVFDLVWSWVTGRIYG